MSARSAFFLAFVASLALAQNAPDAAWSDLHIRNLDKVSEGLYRGARPSCDDLARLHERLGIRTVVNLERAKIKRGRKCAQAAGIENYFAYSLNPFHRPSYKDLKEILGILADKNARPVYVHCTHGEDRTGLIVALNRVINEGWAPQRAYAEMLAHHFHNRLLTGLNATFDDYIEANAAVAAPVSPASH